MEDFEKQLQEKENIIKELKAEVGKFTKLEEDYTEASKEIETLKLQIKEQEDREKKSTLERYAKNFAKEAGLNDNLVNFIEINADKTEEQIKTDIEKFLEAQKSIENQLLESYSEVKTKKSQDKQENGKSFIESIIENSTKKSNFKF